ncbi:MAG: ribonuclease HII [Candidatus Bathyarchaeia archaeon]
MGPLLIAGVLVKSSDLERLKAIGVRDSKLLTPAQRLILATKIEEIALKVAYVEIQPKEIDAYVLNSKKFFKLNYLEAKAMAKVIEELRPDIAYVDASDISAERFGRQIESFLPLPVRVISEHKADRKYVVVGAASILAKTRRDRALNDLTRIYGEMGNGYPHDPLTLNFLRKWLREHNDYPDFVRKSWETARRIKEEVLRRQTELA